ncbi:effector-associated domain EAD1-containing protein [Bradyrhizobium sp. CSS354]|uniref:effector-associated domain EAD1-containing protein n=1 Tax=Bradyrhizobium sp. CSS354 TaxID=2699172 RepID=UPI0023B01920|nr:effector-associated domain EAD1-containing protein [Bradyrhizobium sp. CSS354]MDE5461338.1 hypothetical protein [Bradyrhizobium sp. CSS354]
MTKLSFDGVQRVKLRDAILSGFDFTPLVSTLRDNNLSTSSMPVAADLRTQVDALIDTAFKEGWLGSLCLALANARQQNAPLQKVLLEVNQWFVTLVEQSARERESILIETAAARATTSRKIAVVLSSVGTDAAWKENFRGIGGFIDALQPCDVVDTLERFKQSRESVRSIFRDIDRADLFVAFLSRRYLAFPQTADEVRRALTNLRTRNERGSGPPKVLLVALDQESIDCVKRETTDVQELLTISEFYEGNVRKAIVANKVVDDGVATQISSLGESLRQSFDDLPSSVGQLGQDAPGKIIIHPPDPPVASASTSQTIVVLGEPRSIPDHATTSAIEELIDGLVKRNIPHQRWADGWREVGRSQSELASFPLFVRAVSDPSQSSAKELLGRLSSELNVSFGFQFDEQGENVRPLSERPKVVWRPNGPKWDPAATGPLLFSSSDSASDFARWLSYQIGQNQATSNAIVHYEDPADRGDSGNRRRREAVEESLCGAISSKIPPLIPDSLPFGYQQLQEVIDSITFEGDKLTVLAAHDMRSKFGSSDDTLQRFRDIDRRIEESLIKRKIANARLMRVAVLLRNWKLFPALEFSRSSRVSKWQLLRIVVRSDGTLVPDKANLERLRDYAASLMNPSEQAAS